MTALHTPGPWEVASNSHYPVIRKQFRADHHMDICGPVHGYMYAEDEKANQAANARLIAAAPDLLAELRTVVFHLRRDDFNGRDTLRQQAIDSIDAAIARATGAAT